MIGVDLSNNNSKLDLGTIIRCVDFVIMKVSEGDYFKDMYANLIFGICKKVNAKVGFYHFMRNNSPAETQMDFFIESVIRETRISEKEFTKYLFCLDWECENILNIDVLKDSILILKNKYGIDAVVYTSASVYENINTFGNSRWWIASWGTNKPFNLLSDNVEQYIGKANYHSMGFIHQFTSKGIIQGNTPLDLNYLTKIPKEWERVQESLSLEMQWAIDNGIFKGKQDGLIHPDEPLSRNEAAIILKRFYNTFGPQSS